MLFPTAVLDAQDGSFAAFSYRAVVFLNPRRIYDIFYHAVGNSDPVGLLALAENFKGALAMSQVNPHSLGTAVVTGASSGLGKVYADRLAARGYDLLLVARRKDRLDAIAADLQTRFPVKVRVLAADLAHPGGLAEASTAISGDPTITLLVNNAGTSSVEPVAQTSGETITNLIALNVTALTVLTKSVLPCFIERNAGTIVNVGSAVGFSGHPWVPVYGGTKAYVLNFTQGLKQQLAETKIRFQYVAPASTVSEIWDVVGVPVSSLGEGVLMDTGACVDAALQGLDDGEFITAPSVPDEALVRDYEEASTKLLAATQRSEPAPRYAPRS